MVTKKIIFELLEKKNIKTTEKTLAGLSIVALDNKVLSKEDLLTKPKEPKQLKELKKEEGLENHQKKKKKIRQKKKIQNMIVLEQ